MYAINLNIISWWLKLLRPLDVKILTKTKTPEYMFKHITNRTNNDAEENSLIEVIKQNLLDAVTKLMKITELADETELLMYDTSIKSKFTNRRTIQIYSKTICNDEKKIDGTNFQLKDIFFRVWKQIKTNDECIKTLETSISNATDMCTNRPTDSIMVGCSLFFDGFNSYCRLTNREKCSNLCVAAASKFTYIKDKIKYLYDEIKNFLDKDSKAFALLLMKLAEYF